MARGRGGRYSGSRADGFDDVRINFNLFPLDVNGNEIQPNNVTLNEIPAYSFSNVVENFGLEVTTEDDTSSSSNDFQFAFAPNGQTVNINNISTLNLTV